MLREVVPDEDQKSPFEEAFLSGYEKRGPLDPPDIGMELAALFNKLKVDKYGTYYVVGLFFLLAYCS